MFIKTIKFFDEDSGEAYLIISDGTYELLCFCGLLQNETNLSQKIKKIESFLCDNIIKVNSNKYLILKQADFYSYHLRGKILDLKKQTVNIGEIIIELDKPFPNDLKKGDFIEFDVFRLDCSICNFV